MDTSHIKESFSKSADEVVNILETDKTAGLTAEEASKRLAQFGKNSLGEEKKVPLWKRFLAQFADAMVIILIVAAGLSAVMAYKEGGMEGWIDVFVILAIIILNAVLGVYQEGKADQALAALKKMNLKTIGDLAQLNPDFVISYMGKNGFALWQSANGLENEPVHPASYSRPLKSVGNSTTTPRDMTSRHDVWKVITALSAQVASRLRKHHFRAGTVTICVRDTALHSYEKQRALLSDTNDEKEIAKLAMALFDESYDWHAPLRSIGVRTTNLSDEDAPRQMTVFENFDKVSKDGKINSALDSLRARYGYNVVMKGIQLEGQDDLDSHDRVDHPHGGFKEDP